MPAPSGAVCCSACARIAASLAVRRRSRSPDFFDREKLRVPYLIDEAQASNTLCYSVQAPILLAFVGVYVAYLSFPAFVLSVIIVGLAGTV